MAVMSAENSKKKFTSINQEVSKLTYKIPPKIHHSIELVATKHCRRLHIFLVIPLEAQLVACRFSISLIFRLKFLLQKIFSGKVCSYLNVTTNFLNGVIGGPLYNDIREKCIDSNGSSTIFHCHLFNVQRFQGWYFQLG